MEITNGPIHAFGNMPEILSAAGQGQAASVIEPDPNFDRGPSVFFMGTGLPDIRFTYLKDKVAGYWGMVPTAYDLPYLQSASVIPATVATNNICAAQAPTAAVAMTLAVASTGITPAVPIPVFTGTGGFNAGTIVTTGLALDFGFAFGTTVAGTKQITVADSTKFFASMPLVIGGVGNVAGTTCLLTYVTSIDSAVLITLNDAPLATNAAAPIGMGNIWCTGTEISPTAPTAAVPYRACGPGLFLDPEQALMRGVQISSAAAGAAGGTFLVTGYDTYGMLMSELVTVAAGASTGWSKKVFKYIVSVVPTQTDAQTYLVGTSDVVGFAFRADLWDNTQVTWNAGRVVDSTGFVAAVGTAATTITGDVRGTVQLSANGGAAAITLTAATNGAIVALAMSGRRLTLSQFMPLTNVVRGIVTDTRTMFGVTQA